MGKSTISMAIFNSYVQLSEGTSICSFLSDFGSDPSDLQGKYYHPSNAKFWFYGDDPADARLELVDQYLSQFEKIEAPKDEGFMEGWWKQMMDMICLVVKKNMAFIIFHFIYGLSSFPLTNSYFSRLLKPPTRYIYIYNIWKYWKIYG